MAQNNMVKVKVLLADLRDCDPEAYVLIQDDERDVDLMAYDGVDKSQTEGAPCIVLTYRDLSDREFEIVEPEEAE